MRSHRQTASELINPINEIKTVKEKLITGIPECLREPLMQVAYKLLIRDDSAFEELTPQEQELWSKVETDDIYRFLTGEPDTVPKFCFNWMTVPLVTADFENNQAQAAPLPAPQAHQGRPAPPPTPPMLSSSSSSLPHSSPTPLTSGTQPQLMPWPSFSGTQVTRDPSGASTLGTCPVSQPTLSTLTYIKGTTRNLRQLQKVNYKQLHPGKAQFVGRQAFLK